jgi:hypothetical protein
MMPLVSYVLTQYAAELLPQDRRERFQERLVRAACNNLAGVQEWLKILKVLTEAGIPVISFKGPTLGLTAYRSLALREFTDLDLLVQPRDVLKTRDALVRNEYVLDSVVKGDTDAAFTGSSDRQISFSNVEGEITVDLHWGVLHEMFSFQLEVGQLFESARLECHNGTSFLSLSPECLLLYLCAHGTKHCWISLRWLCDVACYVQTVQELDWNTCLRRAEAANCDLVLKHSLLLAQQVLGLELPSIIRDYVCGDAKATALANRASAFLFREDGELGYHEALRYHLAFANGWGDRIRLVFERVFVPAEPDWQRVRLPRFLHFLYYLVRPARFLIERFSNTNW